MTDLSEVLLLGGKVGEASGELGVPGKLGEGDSGRRKLSHFGIAVVVP